MIFEFLKDYDVVVFEMGISNFGEINRLVRIVMLDIGVIINIGVVYIEYLKIRENIFKEKMCIVDFFENKNLFVINCENDMLKIVNEYNKVKLEKIGYNESYDFYVKNVKLICENIFFDVIIKDNKSYIFILNMIGEYNVLNVLLGI